MQQLLGKKPTVTCDPTVLWEPSFWGKFVLDGYAPKEKYVLIYDIENQIKEKTRIVVLFVSNDFDNKETIKKYMLNKEIK